MRAVTPSNEPESQRPINSRNLATYVAGGVNDEIRERINRQLNVPGSAVRTWIEEMDVKLADPLNVNWRNVAFAETSDCGRREVEERSPGRQDQAV